MTEVLKTFLRDVGDVVRHLLPGALLVFAAYVGHPRWFEALAPTPSSAQLIVLAVVGLALGNLAYIFNRYVLVQGIEALVYWAQFTRRLFAREYAKVVATELVSFYGRDMDRFRGVIRFRDASVAGLIAGGQASLLLWNPQPPSVLAQEPSLVWAIRGLGVGLVVLAFWVHMITRLMVREKLSELEASPPKQAA